MIALLPAYSHAVIAPGYEPLTEGPNYVRSANSTRWHRPRSGARWDSGRISYAYWCGANNGDCGVESIGPDEPLCATCEGRFEAQEENRLLFNPRSVARPRICPASGREDMVPDTRKRYFHCLVCGEITAWRARHRYDSGVAVSRHESGDDLVEPCRFHGWNRLTVRGGVVVCSCGDEAVAS